MKPIQCKLARVALGWGVRDLAREAGVSPTTVAKFEGGEKLRDGTVAQLKETMERAGVVFIPQNGGGPGVRLRDPV